MADKNPPILTKTCSGCGEEKPLSAFLQMSGTQHGTAYGNICANCRRAAKDAAKNRKKTDVEGGTSSETGHKIDSKTKVHEEITDALTHQHEEEEYFKERELDDIEREELEEEKEEIKEKERHHRERFLKSKKDDTPEEKAAKKREAVAQHGQETVAAEERKNIKDGLAKHGKQEEHKQKGHDFSVTFHGQQIAGQIKFQGQYFQQFKKWLGNSAPIVRNLTQTERTAQAKKAGAIAEDYAHVKESGKAAQHKEKAQPGSVKQSTAGLARSGLMGDTKNKQGQNKDVASEYVEKNWRPGSKR